jgi:hypothetical protein
MIVSRSLDLSAGTFYFDAGSLIVENEATIIRRRTTAVLSSSPSYRASVNVTYLVDPDNGNLAAYSELPSDPSILRNLRVSNTNPSPDSNSVVLNKNVNIRGTLSLDGGQLDWGLYRIMIAEGATVEVAGGKFKPVTGASSGVVASTYNLVYRRSATVTATSLEFQSGPTITIPQLTILGSDQSTPTTLYLYANRTVGKLLIDAPQGGVEFGPPGSFVARNLTVKDSLTVLNGGFTNTSGTNAIVNLAGTNRQVISVSPSGLTMPGGGSAVHLQLNNGAGFLLQGGDLKFGAGAVMFFVNGVLSTGDNSVILAHTATSQGFDRQAVSGSHVSHIAGRVRHLITGGAGNVNEYPNGRYEFPTGTLTDYRPLVISFTNAYPAVNPSTVDVSHVDQSPGGTRGLPLDGEVGVRVGSYTPFCWRVATSVGGFGDDQTFDLEGTVRNTSFRFSKVEDLRFIVRRDENPISSAWNLLGSGLGYGTSSITVTPAKDTILSLRVMYASHGLAGTNLVTVGLPARPLVFAGFLPDTTIKENQTLQYRYAVGLQEPGGTIAYALVNPPRGASIDSANGILTWTPAYGQAGTYTIVVSATDGQQTIVATAKVVVSYVNRKPVLNFRLPFSVSQIAFNTPTTFKISVSDPDNQPLTVSWKVNGSVVKVGSDTSFTSAFQGSASLQSVRAVFSDPLGLSDSTEWNFMVVDVRDNEAGIPADFALRQNYPNPFNPGTMITIAIPQRSHVQVDVYTMQGRRIRVLFDGELDAGYHRVLWDGRDDTGGRVSSGAYMSRLRAGSFVQSRKMILIN